MGFRMKDRYETGEEFYQDIKNHLIEDGFGYAQGLKDSIDTSVLKEKLNRILSTFENKCTNADEKAEDSDEDGYYNGEVCAFEFCMSVIRTEFADVLESKEDRAESEVEE